MNRHKIAIKSDTARQLASSDAYKAFVSEVQDGAISAFLNSAAGDTLAREEAHAIIRALNEIQGAINSAITAEKMALKRDQHRGND